MSQETWDLWYPDAASQGIPFARGMMDAGASVVLVHALPESIRVEVRDQATGVLAASGDHLEREGAKYPMSRLVREGASIRREDGWPTEDDIGRLVILPGGEIGTLTSWWNAGDGSEWRWSVEFYNHK